MKKLLRHKWRLTTTYPVSTYQCEKCGCIKKFDFGYDRTMYFWGTHITYRAPSCIGMNGVPYNK